MRPRPEWSLRLRLSLFFALLLFVAWSVAAVWSWRESVERIDTFFDTQQMLFAKRLAFARYSSLTGHLPDTDKMLADHGDEGEQEDDALAFAVFTPEGELLLSDGEEGKNFAFSLEASGFVNSRVDGEWWRIVWLHSLDRRVVVAVGQELEYRDEMVLEMITAQMLPWLFLVPVLLCGLVWMLGRELAPLRSVAVELSRRSPDDTAPVGVTVQSEIRPLLYSLNSLFTRVGAMLRRERAFIANAAHELRTPLAGLSIQSEVAQNAKQPETRAHALAQLRKGINRTSRLVDQLLMLFKLDISNSDEEGSRASPAQVISKSPMAWGDLLQSAVTEIREYAEMKEISLMVTDESDGAVIYGQSELFDVLLRNALGNAVKYTPQTGEIRVSLTRQSLTISNTGQPMDAADAARLGERFFRPPGQAEPGSGLGLSIVRRIVQLHGLDLKIDVKPDWFTLTLHF